MNWEAIATLAEVTAALGVIASLIYVALQLRASHITAADSNRINRARGVCDIMLSLATNDEFRRSYIKVNRLESYFENMASEFDVSSDDAARSDFANTYWFWLHWGQYSSTTHPKDLEDLKIVIYPYVEMPAMKYSWDNSYMAKPSLDKSFIEFVENTLAAYEKDKLGRVNNVT